MRLRASHARHRAHSCTGDSALCTDNVAPSDTVCRAAARACDVAETCDGEFKNCPFDYFAANGTECRPKAGPCDKVRWLASALFCWRSARSRLSSATACPTPVRRTCLRAPQFSAETPLACAIRSNSALAAQPVVHKVRDLCCIRCGRTFQQPAAADRVFGSEQACRPKNGPCDVEERCSGASVACPADALSPPGSLCRAAAAECDVAELCDGANAQCPVDAARVAGTLCRAATGACDGE